MNAPNEQRQKIEPRIQTITINTNVPPNPPLEVCSSCKENSEIKHEISLHKQLENLDEQKIGKRVTEWSPLIRENVDHRHTIYSKPERKCYGPLFPF